MVRPQGEDYEVIAGERRYRAALLAQLECVPCLVKDLTDEEAKRAALDENLSREDLNPIEILDSILQILSLRLNRSQDDIVKLLKEMRGVWGHDKTRTQVGNINIPDPDDESQTLIYQEFERFGYNWFSFASNQLKLRELPEDIYEAISSGLIEYSKGLRFKIISDPQDRSRFLNEAIASNWSQKEIGVRIKEWRAAQSKTPTVKPTPQERVKQLGDRVRSQNWRARPELLSQLEKKLANLEKWLDENEEKFSVVSNSAPSDEQEDENDLQRRVGDELPPPLGRGHV